MEHGKGLAVTVLRPCQSSPLLGEGATWVCNVGHLLAQLLLANATINKNLFGGFCFAVLCCVCKQTAQNIHILSRTAECRLQTQREQLQKGRDMQLDGMAFGIGVKLH